jgi:hypothetical protein
MQTLQPLPEHDRAAFRALVRSQEHARRLRARAEALLAALDRYPMTD